MTPTNEDLLALADRADSWNRCYPGNLNVELLVDDLSAALRAIVAERDRLRAVLTRVATAYDITNWMRTADMHPTDCTCIRCAVDEARAALKGDSDE